MQLDPHQFLHHLEPFDMSDAHKVEYVQAIIHIMQSFVDRAFGDAPEQTSLGTSENNGINHGPDALKSESPITSTFNQSAKERGQE